MGEDFNKYRAIMILLILLSLFLSPAIILILLMLLSCIIGIEVGPSRARVLKLGQYAEILRMMTIVVFSVVLFPILILAYIIMMAIAPILGISLIVYKLYNMCRGRQLYVLSYLEF